MTRRRPKPACPYCIDRGWLHVRTKAGRRDRLIPCPHCDAHDPTTHDAVLAKIERSRAQPPAIAGQTSIT